MKLCIAGKNNIAVDCMYYAINKYGKQNICIIPNKNDIGKNNWQKSLLFHANLNNIAVVSLNDVYEIDDLVFLSLEFDRIIKPNLFKSKKLFNIHFSLLPKYKGMYTSLHPILNAEKYSGVTLHEIDKGIDTGKIIIQDKFLISGLNCESLYFKYLKHGTNLVCENFDNIVNGTYQAKKQKSISSTYYSRESFDFSKKEINPNQTAFQIMNFVNALNFSIFQLPIFQGVKIKSCKISNTNSKYKPGYVIERNKKSIKVCTIDYDIELFIDYYEQLIDFCINNNYKDLFEIIEYVDVNKRNNMGWTPLIIACYNGSYDVVKLLIKHGADVNKANLNGTSTLMYAKDNYLKTRNANIIDLLVHECVDVYSKDIWGKNVFDYTDDISFKQHTIKS